MRRLADKHNALVIYDEVQTGFGRTGKLYAYMHTGITPDILTTAKALGGGFPIGAMLTTHHIAKHLKIGSHGSTYGGNPLVCAVSLAAMKVINTPEVLAGVSVREQLLRQGLAKINQQYNIFSEIRGQGLIGAALMSNLKAAPKTF